MRVIGKGIVQIKPLHSSFDVVTIEAVKVIPNIALNLLSVSQMVRKGLNIHFNNAGVTITDRNGDTVATGEHVNNMFKIKQRCDKAMNVVSCDCKLWHKRLAHLNSDSMKRLRDCLVTGIQFSDAPPSSCISCVKGKQFRFPFKSSKSKSNDILELVHSDISGPMEVKSVAGSIGKPI